MIDAYTVLRKELLEVFGGRYAFRGPLLQAALVICITGLVVPALDASIWSPSAVMMLYVIFPSTLASMFAAEAFAGEEERRTLETLLSTPLRDGALFLGKTATAVLFVIAVSAFSLSTGMAVAAVRGLLPTPVSPLLILSVLGGALSGGLLTAAIAIVASVHIPVARSAQQVSFMPTLMLGMLGVVLLDSDGELKWPSVLRRRGRGSAGRRPRHGGGDPVVPPRAVLGAPLSRFRFLRSLPALTGASPNTGSAGVPPALTDASPRILSHQDCKSPEQEGLLHWCGSGRPSSSNKHSAPPIRGIPVRIQQQRHMVVRIHLAQFEHDGDE